MRKEDLLKIEGMTEAIADAVIELNKDMIPKTRLDEVIAERDNARKDHADLLKQVKELEKTAGATEELKTQIQKLQSDAKEAQKAHADEITALKIDNAVNSALSGAKALNIKAVKALLNLEGAELAADGSVKGLAEQIKTLTEAEDSKFLFGSVAPSGSTPADNPNPNPTEKKPSEMTYEDFVNQLK